MNEKKRLDVEQVSCNIGHMARGPSGRLVLEIDPIVKRQIHARVAAEGRTLKDWFLEQVERYLHQPEQLSLTLENDRPQQAHHEE